MGKNSLLTLLSTCAMLFFVSCASDLNDLGKEIPKKSAYKVEISQALEIADVFMDKLSAEPTRGVGRMVETINVITAVKTRVSGVPIPDTLYYVVNYADEKGFAVLGADKRLAPVYAISDKGHINMEDTIYNKGLAQFFREIQNKDIQRIALNGGDDGDDDSESKEWNFREEYGGPLLHPTVSQWGQYDPYWKYCPIYSGGYKTLVGCVPLSTCQVMSFYEWPQYYEGRKLDWTEMKENINSDDLAWFLVELGSPNNLNADYTPFYLTLVTDQTRPLITFQNCGYTTWGDYEKVTKEKIIEAVKEKPLMVNNTDLPWHIGSWHHWVIDGYASYYSEGSVEGGNEKNYLYDMIHCVWGENGKGNGYFLYTRGYANNPEDRTEYDKEEGLNFYFDLISMWNGYLPNK